MYPIKKIVYLYKVWKFEWSKKRMKDIGTYFFFLREARPMGFVLKALVSVVFVSVVFYTTT